MIDYQKFTIVVPTFNSGRTLGKTLHSLRKQNYPTEKVEILIIDGGSTDKTKSIAKRFNCKIFQNPKTELIYGKFIGLTKATGDYLMFLDSDEVLENENSLKLKSSVFKKNKKIKAVFLSGYKTLENFLQINHYSNEFGEPFSFFMYRESKGDKFLLKSWSDKFHKVYEDRECAVFDFSRTKLLPIIELWAGGCTIDLNYVRKIFPQINQKPELIAHLFYLLNEKKNLLAISKNDPTIHCSSENYTHYLKKINSRVKNNVFGSDMGKAGFSGRETFQPWWSRFKKYIFPVYSFSIFFPIVDGLLLSLSRRKWVYLLHAPLSVYTAALIIYYQGLRVLGVSPEMKTYGR